MRIEDFARQSLIRELQRFIGYISENDIALVDSKLGIALEAEEILNKVYDFVEEKKCPM